MAIFEAFDTVVVPFPFTDRTAMKRRPALVLSSWETFGERIGHGVLAMITSAAHGPWPLDVAIDDLDAAGLPAPSVVRMKLFTLDFRLILRTAGRLAPTDRGAVQAALGEMLAADVETAAR